MPTATWRRWPASPEGIGCTPIRYFHQAAGLNGAAQIVHDLGARADPRKLARAAAVYENSTARRLGYLLENFGHARQAASLRPLARKAKSFKPLDPSVRPVASLVRSVKVSEAPTWKLSLNVPLEIDGWFAELNGLAAEPFMPKGRRQSSTPGRDVFDDDGS